MFSKIGTGELLVILAIALFVIGPQKLPEAAKSIGKALGMARKYLKVVTDEVKAETGELEEEVQEIKRDLKDAKRSLDKPFDEGKKGDQSPVEPAVEIGEPQDQETADEMGEEMRQVSA